MSFQGFNITFNWEQQQVSPPHQQQQVPPAQLHQPPPQVNRAPSFGDVRKRTWSEESSGSVSSTQQNDSSMTSSKRTKRSHSDENEGPPCSFRRRYS